jgi:hypothetical protein
MPAKGGFGAWRTSSGAPRAAKYGEKGPKIAWMLEGLRHERVLNWTMRELLSECMGFKEVF